ncbi:MAG: hypothetical protein ACRELB_14870 [Polyangiaceae bacterium]
MTVDFGEYYGVTVHHAEHIGPRLHRAKGEVFRRDTFKVIGHVTGEGTTRSSADDRCIEAGRDWVRGKGEPEDWKGTKRS